MSSRAAAVFRNVLAILGVLILLAIFALWRWPPDLLRVGSNYAAKIVCSNVFLAGRESDDVLVTDVEAPGVALMRLMQVSLDPEHGVVRAGLLGFIGNGLAVHRPGRGCTTIPDGDLAAVIRHGDKPQGTMVRAARRVAARPLWPEGEAVETRAALDRMLEDKAIAGPGIRAIVVVDHGHIIAERYGSGITAATPLLGWSMTKTVVAGLGVETSHAFREFRPFAGVAHDVYLAIGRHRGGHAGKIGRPQRLGGVDGVRQIFFGRGAVLIGAAPIEPAGRGGGRAMGMGQENAKET